MITICVQTLGHAVGTLEVRAPGYDFRSAEYSASHVYIDEIAGTTANIEVLWNLAGFTNITDVEVYTNINRRDLARIDKNGDGYADGIQPVNGTTITDSAADTNPTTGHYFAPINMTDGDSNNIWELTIPAAKTGAYRLTARFKTSNAIAENNNDPSQWIWYGLRDHAVVVAPTTSRDIQLYVMNVFNIEASGDTFATRSTLEDLHDASDAVHNFGGGGSKWNLDYMKGLGMNWLWFQPIHPVGIDGREPSGGYDTPTPPYDPGSPYAVKNFFEVNELMTVDYNGANTTAQNRAASMAAFQEFAAAADAKDVGIMLDAPFNHTAFDVELAQQGVDLFQPDGQTWGAYDEIRTREARFFSADGNYGNRASSAANIAAGPDRFDFGKWRDVKDVFFGRYDALVEFDSEPERSSYTSEGDWFDYSDTDWTANDFTQDGQQWNVTRRVWDYFAEYAVHWLERTRPTNQNRNSLPSDGDVAARYAWDARGIDGLRCDFGQGLPPQAWEYIINVARSHKWNFVMMSESLDGGAVTYRSSRHFEILNENIVFPLKSATTAQDYRNIFDGRRNAYGQALVLANTTSHDEENYADPWQALVRNAAVGAMDSASLVFPGQELGIVTDNKGNSDASDNFNYGYDHYETNFGKTIPHFKRWNSMMPIWNDNDYGNDQLYPVYSGIQTARNNSPALRSSNRWFLTGDGNNNQIYAVAKYETPNASPATSDVVLAFSNLDRNNDQSDNFKIPAGLGLLLGLNDNRTYNAKNISAYTAQDPNRRDALLWGGGITGANLKSVGFFVGTNKVPTTEIGWSTDPYEAQYLKVYDVTIPVATPSQPNMPNNHDYEIGTQAKFDWTDVQADSEGVVPHYEVTVIINSGDPTTFITTESEYTVNAAEGNQVSISVRAVNPNDNTNKGPTSSQSQAIKLLSATGDEDGDGRSNSLEKAAGTNPRDPSSIFETTSAVVNGSDYDVSFTTVVGRYYHLETSTDLGVTDVWTAVNRNNLAAGASMMLTHSNGAAGTRRFYRVRVTEDPLPE
ncbi:MAG: hypothetical protein AB8F34_07405 [Akkermansiaceae bacterium]